MALNPIGNPNFAKDAADTIERLVGTVRDNTTKHVITAARGVVFGLLAAFAGLVGVILLIVVATRLVQMAWAWPFDSDSSVWLSYMTVGGISTAVGLLLMARRHPKSAD